jgi:hypothetical protein
MYKENSSLKVMEKRAHNRISTKIDARFFHGNLFYSGSVTNISQKGMFINTKRLLPSGAIFVVLIRIENQLLKVIARVRRNVRDNSGGEGMGVELLSPSEMYMNLVSGLQGNN